MSVFTTYLQLGFLHICSWQATDHLTFLLALCAPYVLADWRRVVALVTSFTVGHSITLALATLGDVWMNSSIKEYVNYIDLIIHFSSVGNYIGNILPGGSIVEALIPITIILTALVNMKQASPALAQPSRCEAPVLWAAPNALAAVFGLIHGLGFSNYLRELLGNQSRPVAELLSFNLGVELGQLLVVSGILLLGFVLLRVVGVARRDWILTVSGAALGVATLLLLQMRA
ncbi:MAG: HupE/UreJ family protein [Janthinobacterium lividum]